MKVIVYWQDGSCTTLTDLKDNSAVVKDIRDGTVFDTIQVWKYVDGIELLNFKYARQVKLIEDEE